jgi:hypothetical protein
LEESNPDGKALIHKDNDNNDDQGHGGGSRDASNREGNIPNNIF